MEKEIILSDIIESINNLKSILNKLNLNIENIDNYFGIDKIEKIHFYVSYLDKKILEIDDYLKYYDGVNHKFINEINYIIYHKKELIQIKDLLIWKLSSIYIDRHWEIINSINLNIIDINILKELYNINTYELMDFLSKNNIVIKDSEIKIIEPELLLKPELSPKLIESIVSKSTQKLWKLKIENPNPNRYFLLTSEKIDKSLIAKTKNPEIKEFWWLKTNKNWFISIALLWVDAGDRRADAIKQILIDPVSWKIAIISVLRDIGIKTWKKTLKINDIRDENSFKSMIEEISWQDVVYTSRFNMNTIISEFEPSFKTIFPDWIKLSKLTDKYSLSIISPDKIYDSNSKISDMNEFLQLIRARHDGRLLNDDWSRKKKIDIFWDVLRSKRQWEILDSIFRQFINDLSIWKTIDWLKLLPSNFLKWSDWYIWYPTLIMFSNTYHSKFWINASSISIEPRIDKSYGWKIQINSNKLRSDIRQYFQ